MINRSLVCHLTGIFTKCMFFTGMTPVKFLPWYHGSNSHYTCVKDAYKINICTNKICECICFPLKFINFVLIEELSRRTIFDGHESNSHYVLSTLLRSEVPVSV